LDYDPNDEEAVFRYFDDAYDDLVERMQCLDQFSVGDAIQVEFEDELVLKHEIGRFGRMVRNNGTNVYRAGPSKVDTSLKYEMIYPGHLDEFEKWAQNEQVTFEFCDRYEAPPPVRDTTRTTLHKVETDTIRAVSNIVSNIHLAYPSEGTIWRCEKVPISVQVQASRDSTVKALLAKVKPGVHVKVVENGDPSELWYLGSNGPWYENLPPHWFCLVPNPFQEKFPYNPHTMSSGIKGISVAYTRNGLVQDFLLPNEPNYYLIPPSAIAARFSVVSDAYFLATNFMPILGLFDVTHAKRAPLIGYLPRLPPYVNGVSRDENYIYDREGPGTYASRRHAISAQGFFSGSSNIPLCPLSQVESPYAVTFYDPKPVGPSKTVSRGGVTSYIGPFEVGIVPSGTDRCFIYGPLMENGAAFRDFIGNYVVVPCRYTDGRVQFMIPAQCKRPLYVFHDYKHLAMSQFELCNELLRRGLRPEVRCGGIGRTQKVPTNRLVERIGDIMADSPLTDSVGQLGVSDDDVAMKLGISVAQAENLLVNHKSLIYLGQWDVMVPKNGMMVKRTRGYWILASRFTETRSGRLVTDYLREWRETGEIMIDVGWYQYFRWFFYHQGNPVINVIRRYDPVTGVLMGYWFVGNKDQSSDR